MKLSNRHRINMLAGQRAELLEKIADAGKLRLKIQVGQGGYNLPDDLEMAQAVQSGVLKVLNDRLAGNTKALAEAGVEVDQEDDFLPGLSASVASVTNVLTTTTGAISGFRIG